MKTWKRFGYESKDGTLYIGSEEDLIDCKEDHKLRIMKEAYYQKIVAERRMYKRVYDAAMAWQEHRSSAREPDVSRYVMLTDILQKKCEKARDSRKVKK
jgi:hypothetical protein